MDVDHGKKAHKKHQFIARFSTIFFSCKNTKTGDVEDLQVGIMFGS
jgi:hypothetical protein